MKKAYKIALAAVMVTGLAGFGTAGTVEDHVVEQKDKTFFYKGQKADKLTIKVGDVVHFKNMDPYFHNVFSLSDVKLFDLGSFPQGQEKTVVFNKAGKVEVECAIHPQMHVTLEVK